MSNFRSWALALAFGLCAATASAIPYPGYYFPSGMQAGTKIRLVIGGTGMGGVKGAYVTGDGVEVTRIVKVPGFPRATGKTQRPWVCKWVYDILEKKSGATAHRELPPEAMLEDTDWAECLWWPYVDERDDLELQIIMRDMFTPENYPQATPALDNLLILDIEAAPNATPGRRDIIIYDSRSASAPHTFYITREPHVQEKFFVIPDRAGYQRRRLPAALHIPTEIKPQSLPVWIDGQDWPGETDSYYLRLEEGQNLVCDFVGRELLPYLGDAVPGFFNPMIRLYNARGDQVATADDFYYLPDPLLTYKVPEDGFYRLDVHDNLFRGRSDFVYTVHCYNAPDDAPPFTPQQRAFWCFPPPAAHVPPKASSGDRIVKKGTLKFPGHEDRYFLDIKDPGEWKFELFARRQGAPLDGVLKLYGPMGTLPLSAAPRLAVWDDDPGKLYALKNVGDDETPIIKTNMLYVGSVPQVECDPVGTWKFTEPGRYCVTVSDRVRAGGENYDYTLCMAPFKPTFEVYASTSAFVDSGRFKAHVLRRGFKGPITFNSTEELEVSGEFSDDEEVETEVSVRPTKAWKGVFSTQITASGELPNGERITVRVTPCDPVEQAFAYTHLLPQAAFFFCNSSVDVVERNPHPTPHLASGKKKPTTHSNGQACISCHNKKKKDHTHGQACNSCHKDKK